MEKKIVKVEGELFWAKWMGEFNNAFGDTDRYECVIGNLTEESVKRLESIGVKVKYRENRPEQGQFIISKSKFKYVPLSKDKNEEVPLDVIGNGTKVTALVDSYTHKMSKQHGNAPSVKKIVVQELKQYIPEGEEDLVL